MNRLHVGTEKQFTFPQTFLLVDDGPIIDALTIPKRRKVTRFDFTKNSFNPLRGIDPKKARELADLIYATAPYGMETLTVRNGKRALKRLLLTANRLDRIRGNIKDPAILEALAAIDDLLFFPVLKDVLCKPTNFSLRGIVIARLPRAELGDFVCFALANFLIANYKGQVVIPDFGFYACPFHTNLIRQERLIAGVNFLDEAPEFRNQLLLIDEKIPQHCTIEDAETLAGYTGKAPNSNGYNDFIQSSIE